MSAASKDPKRFTEIRNAKAFHLYHVGERMEAGIVLRGTEMKSLRQGQAQLADAFVRIEGGAPVMHHAHINEYAQGNIHNHPPRRPRKLLLHAREIAKLKAAVEMQGMTVIPLRLYFKGGLAKAEIALCKGKNQADKRETLRRKTELREAQRVIRKWK
ncbi:MAG TPA: SsrA-binding protein SmpB [Opitutales bacterium]|jgi:SsrA-binding protein|nr:SsrA-binding protein SmpB [Opitutales bacterium]